MENDNVIKMTDEELDVAVLEEMAQSHVLIEDDNTVEAQYELLSEADPHDFAPEGTLVWGPYENMPVCELLDIIDNLSTKLHTAYNMGKTAGLAQALHTLKESK